MGSSAEHYVRASQRSDLTVTKARLDREEQERPVSPSDPGGRIGGLHQGLHLRLDEELQGGSHIAFDGDRKYPLAVEGVGRLGERNVAEEGV
jgi:hypothetical protein